MIKYRIVYRLKYATSENQKEYLSVVECKNAFLDMKKQKMLMYAVILRVEINSKGSEKTLVIGNYYL